jgi:uncharacterized protein (TIGR04255 family)
MIKLPKKITPCPIIDSVIELRFQSSVEPGAVFGIVYNAFKSEYPTVEKMPILNLPEEIRLKDEKIKYNPWYRLRNGGFILGVGARELHLGKAGEYAGWEKFSKRMYHVVKTIKDIDVVSKIERVALRYINFFGFDIFDKIKLVVSHDKKNVTENETLVRTVIPGERFRSRLVVTNKTSVTVEGKVMEGSVVDIDTFCNTDLDNFFDNAIHIIEEGHIEEKTVFFSLLREDFLQTLNPEY